MNNPGSPESADVCPNRRRPHRDRGRSGCATPACWRRLKPGRLRS